PAAGRLLEPAHHVMPPPSPAAVISYRYWQRRFGGSSSAIGKTFTLKILNKVFTIVGVTPPGYTGTHLGSDPDLTLPLLMTMNDTQTTYNMLNMLGRLAPGATIEQANAEMQVLWKNYRPRNPAQRAAVISAARGLSPVRYDY